MTAMIGAPISRRLGSSWVTSPVSPLCVSINTTSPGRNTTEVAVKRLGGVQEVSRRAGRGERRGDLLPDQPRLAHAGDDHATTRGLDRPVAIGVGKRIADLR